MCIIGHAKRSSIYLTSGGPLISRRIVVPNQRFRLYGVVCIPLKYDFADLPGSTCNINSKRKMFSSVTLNGLMLDLQCFKPPTSTGNFLLRTVAVCNANQLEQQKRLFRLWLDCIQSKISNFSVNKVLSSFRAVNKLLFQSH